MRTLLEPIMRAEVAVPSEYSEITQNSLVKREAVIVGTGMVGDYATIECEVYLRLL